MVLKRLNDFEYFFAQSCSQDNVVETDPCNRVVESSAEKPSVESELQPIFPESLLVQFEVQDTGIGIRKEKLQDMFNPFTQADASTSRLYGGTGLGLCIVQRYVGFFSISFVTFRHSVALKLWSCFLMHENLALM